MKVILIYDIDSESKISAKILKICRKYLRHVQKSVFEGELTQSQVESLKSEIKRLKPKKSDSIILYTIDSEKAVERIILSGERDFDRTII